MTTLTVKSEIKTLYKFENCDEDRLIELTAMLEEDLGLEIDELNRKYEHESYDLITIELS